MPAALIATSALAADSIGESGRSGVEKKPLNNVYFGEQQLHQVFN